MSLSGVDGHALSEENVGEQLAEIVRGISAPFACGGVVDTDLKGVTVRMLGGAAAATVTVTPPSEASQTDECVV